MHVPLGDTYAEIDLTDGVRQSRELERKVWTTVDDTTAMGPLHP
jgi:hypothetical protein